jgi:hypothetical protein
MAYAGASIDRTQDVGTDPTVVFQTTLVTVEMRDSNGDLMDEGTVKYYAGGWKEFGNTSVGQVSKELLLKSYKFRMTYAGASIDKTQDVEADQTVGFQTGQVVCDDGTCTHYYAGGWQEFTSGMQLLPKAYNFRYNDGTPDTNHLIEAGIVNDICG